MLPAKKKETILILCYILLCNFIFYKLSSFCRHQTNLALKSSNGVNISRERCFLLCIVPYVCFPFLCWIKFFSGCFRLFFIWETKKMVTGCIRQLIVLYSNDCMGIRWGGLSIGHLRRVIILYRRSSEQV